MRASRRWRAGGSSSCSCCRPVTAPAIRSAKMPPRQAVAYLSGRMKEKLADRSRSLAGGEGFRSFIGRAFPGFRWYRYNEVVVDRLQDLVDGALQLPDGSRADRFFCHLRYQTGKSTIIQLFCAWLLEIFPGICIGGSMLRKDQTEDFSKAVQAFYVAAGGKLRTKLIHNWECEGKTRDQRSKFWALSKGSTPTGKPADVLVGDDLLGGEADAAHGGTFLKDKGWLKRQFLSRERVHKQPKLNRCLQILINTRQGLSDIASYWLWLGGWYCVILPTVYDPEKWPISVPVVVLASTSRNEATVRGCLSLRSTEME